MSYTVDKSGGVKLKTALVPELDTADYKDFAKAYAARNLITEFDSNGNVTNAKPVQIAEDGKQVIITQKGINDVLKNVRGNRKSASLLDSIFVLDDIIAGARKVGEAENAKGRVNPYSYYKNKFVDSVGREYSVTVNIKDTPETSRYHYHNLQEAEIKIEPFDGTSADNGSIAGADLIAKGSKVSLQPLGATPGPQPGAAKGTSSLDSYSIQNGAENVKTGAENAPNTPEMRTAVDTNPATHTPEQQAELARYVAATDEGLMDFANRYIGDGEAKFGRYTISDVTERQAAALQKVLGGDFSGYKNAINSDAIKHIDKRHGAKGEQDSTMREPADIARAGYVIANFDNVEVLKNADGSNTTAQGFKGSDGQQAPLVRYSKKIDGNYYVVEAAADNKYKKL